MDTILSSAPVALAVLGYLGYQDWRDGKFSKSKPNVEKALTTMQGDMSHLRLHFNDDLTRILTEMQVDRKEDSKLLAKIAFSQEEIMKYGIRCRKD